MTAPGFEFNYLYVVCDRDSSGCQLDALPPSSLSHTFAKLLFTSTAWERLGRPQSSAGVCDLGAAGGEKLQKQSHHIQEEAATMTHTLSVAVRNFQSGGAERSLCPLCELVRTVPELKY